mgnify:CR=1 FL=1
MTKINIYCFECKKTKRFDMNNIGDIKSFHRYLRHHNIKLKMEVRDKGICKRVIVYPNQI